MSQSNQQSFGSLFQGLGKTLAIIAGALLVVGVVGLVIFYAFWVTDIKQHHFAYKVDRFDDGKITSIPTKGWTVNTPIRISVYQIDTRPEQRCLKTGRSGVNQRIWNCKLIAFNPDGLNEFIKLHGVQEGNITDILEPYAFDQLGREYPFLTIKDQQSVKLEKGKHISS